MHRAEGFTAVQTGIRPSPLCQETCRWADTSWSSFDPPLEPRCPERRTRRGKSSSRAATFRRWFSCPLTNRARPSSDLPRQRYRRRSAGCDWGPESPLGEPAILSHRLEVPAVCQVDVANEVAGRIHCDSSMLSWNAIEKQLVPSTKRWLDELIPALIRAAGGGFAVEHLPCKVEGE